MLYHMKKTAILWDWDNTLVDTFDAILSAQNIMRQFYGLPAWTPDEAKLAMNTSARNLIKNMIGVEFMVEARKIYLDAYTKNASKIKLKEGALSTLKKAKSLGYINILASNKNGAILRNEANVLKIVHYFDRIIGAEDTPNDKPSKSFTDNALADFSYKKLYSIGDGQSDIKMGHNYENGYGILVWTSPNTPEFENNKPDFSFLNLHDLSIFLEKEE